MPVVAERPGATTPPTDVAQTDVATFADALPSDIPGAAEFEAALSMRQRMEAESRLIARWARLVCVALLPVVLIDGALFYAEAAGENAAITRLAWSVIGVAVVGAMAAGAQRRWRASRAPEYAVYAATLLWLVGGAFYGAMYGYRFQLIAFVIPVAFVFPFFVAIGLGYQLRRDRAVPVARFVAIGVITALALVLGTWLRSLMWPFVRLGVLGFDDVLKAQSAHLRSAAVALLVGAAILMSLAGPIGLGLAAAAVFGTAVSTLVSRALWAWHWRAEWTSRPELLDV